MQMIVSHIERAIPLGNFLTEDGTLSELLGSMMARAGFGLALVTADRRIVYANDTADTLMRDRNGLRCERNCVIAADSTTSRKLQSLITAACRQTGELVQGVSLIIHNEDGAASLVVHIVPLCQSPVVVAPGRKSPVAGLVINDCQRTLSERIRAFADLFTLTPGEARVVSHLITGAGLTKAASRLSIALSTARFHLKHILEKTSTHRQAELVKVFYEVTLPWYGYRDEKDTARSSALRWHGCRAVITQRWTVRAQP